MSVGIKAWFSGTKNRGYDVKDHRCYRCGGEGVGFWEHVAHSSLVSLLPDETVGDERWSCHRGIRAFQSHLRGGRFEVIDSKNEHAILFRRGRGMLEDGAQDR